MKAILLCAGIGSRLKPFTNTLPKCLVEIDGISLLDRQLSILHSCGIDDICVVGGHMSHMIYRKDITVKVNKSYRITNMLFSLGTFLKDIDSDLIISYGDIIYSKNVLESLIDSIYPASVVVDMDWKDYWFKRSDDPLNDLETLKMNNVGEIIEIGQKPQEINEIEGQYIGLIRFQKSIINIVKDVYYDAKKAGFIRAIPFDNAYMTDFIQHLIDLDVTINACKIKGEWVEIDTCKDLQLEVSLNRAKYINDSI